MNVRKDEHFGLSPLIKKQVKPKNCSVTDHLLFCNYSVSYDNYSILKCENVFIRTEKEPLNNERSINRLGIGKLHRHHSTYSAGPINKVFARIFFILIAAT